MSSTLVPRESIVTCCACKEKAKGSWVRPRLGCAPEAIWSDRVFRYLKKISADPDRFERLMWNDVVTLSLDNPSPPLRSIEERMNAQRKDVQKTLITLAGAIEQFEAQYDH